jgi:hypothetical protein
MASKEHKIVRRAQALAELSRLSGLLAGRFNVECPNMRTANHDGELAEIQRIEGINGLLNQVLQSTTQSEMADKAVTKKPVKHGATK